MPRRAKLLYALQRVDLQLARKGRRYREIEANLGESKELHRARAALQAATEEHAHWRKTLLDRELETGSVSEKLRTDEARLYSGQISSPRELGDLQHETEYLKRRQADLEDHQLEAMISLEEATTQLAIANEEFVVVEAAWKADNADLVQEYDTLKQELAQLLAQRKKIVAHVPQGDISEYDSLRRLRKGVAVVAVQHAICTVCNVAVPQRDVDRAAQEDALYYCSGCDRILYVPED
jgi:hypothetical protein